MIYKDYKHWMKQKALINNSNGFRYINEGDVVWVAIGENVGVEIDGKSEKYSRPVVVLKKHAGKCFTGIPLTSQTRHIGKWYVHFVFQAREEVAVIIQARMFDISRVYSRVGELSKGDYQKIKNAFLKYYTE